MYSKYTKRTHRSKEGNLITVWCFDLMLCPVGLRWERRSVSSCWMKEMEVIRGMKQRWSWMFTSSSPLRKRTSQDHLDHILVSCSIMGAGGDPCEWSREHIIDDGWITDRYKVKKSTRTLNSSVHSNTRAGFKPAAHISNITHILLESKHTVSEREHMKVFLHFIHSLCCHW